MYPLPPHGLGICGLSVNRLACLSLGVAAAPASEGPRECLETAPQVETKEPSGSPVTSMYRKGVREGLQWALTLRVSPQECLNSFPDLPATLLLVATSQNPPEKPGAGLRPPLLSRKATCMEWVQDPGCQDPRHTASMLLCSSSSLPTLGSPDRPPMLPTTMALTVSLA